MVLSLMPGVAFAADPPADKPVVNIEGATANDSTTYNGQPYGGLDLDNVKFTAEEIEEPLSLTSDDLDITYYEIVAEEPLQSAPIDAGHYRVELSIKADKAYRGSKSLEFDITPRELSVDKDATTYKVEKTYDGMTDAGNPTGDIGLSGVLNVDEVTATPILRAYDSPDAGTYSLLTEITLAGDKSANYTIDAEELEYIIKPKELTIQSATVTESKTYDGNTNATVTAVTFNGLVNGDLTAGVDYTTLGAYEDANVGNNKKITVTVELKNTDNTKNYIMTGSGLSLDGDITKAAVTITAKDKSAYVGDTAPQLGEDDYTVEGLVGSDVLTTKPSLAYESTPDMSKPGTVKIKASGADAGSNYKISYVDGTLTISNKPSSGGSSASSSFTVPVTGNEKTVNVSASVSGSTASVKKINDADLEKVTDGESVSIDLSGAGKNVDTAKIPTETVEKITEKSSMTVKLPAATVEFDKTATEEIADQAKGSSIELVVDDIKEVSLNAVQKESVGKLDTAIIIDAHLASNGTRLCTADNGGFGGGSAKVILPYEIKNNRKPENYSVYHVNESGKLEKLNAVYDEALKASVFEIEHFSVYAVAYDQFVDIDANAYYYDAVKWAAANGITDGTDSTHFSPNGISNRAQMVTFLWRAAGKPEPTITETPFTDLDPDKYYYKAVLWAYENGITDGTTATTFEPNTNVSRAQVVTFLWRYAGKPVVDYFMNMSDVESGKYYTEAVRWALAEKITDGTTATTFSPNDDCLRGQIVTFLYRDFAK